MEQKKRLNRPLAIDGIIIQNNSLLLIKRGYDPYKNYWAFPGGHVEFDETIEEAVKREIKEETNLTLKSAKLFGIYSSPKRSSLQTIAVVYIVQAEGIPKAGDDAVDIKFYPLDNIPENLGFDHNQIINDYLKK